MKFGQYELLELIAIGGMAEVYKGRVVGAEGFEKHVAIKRILPDLSEDERFVNMLLTEARIHSALSHRNIVQIHDLGISEDGEYFIVLEYVEGYDLRMITEQLAGEIIPEALSLHIAAELAQGLHFAHELRGEDGQPLGLIHRDVSPSNVLISLAGEVKLSDFGLAKRRHDRSVVGSLKGNLAYMSPEQARLAALDRRTDVFSLGAVLFEMLTGRRLRTITDEVAGWTQVASGVVPSGRSVRPDLPEAFEQLLDRALAADPERRFPDAASFGSAIRQLLAQMNTPVGASDLQTLLGALSPPRRPRSPMERSKVIRLGPEAQALREALAAPATPPPVVAPGMTAQPPALAGPRVTVPRELQDSLTPGFDDAPPTPPPVMPLPAVQTRRDRAPAGPDALARSARPTPRGPLPLTRPRPPAPPAVAPVASAPTPPPRAPAPAPRRETAPMRWGGPGGGNAAGHPAGHPAGHSGPGSVRAVAAPRAAAPTWGSGAAAAAARNWNDPAARAAPAWSGAAAVAMAPVPMPVVRRETARVQVRSTGVWRPVAVAISAVLILVASAVHLAVVPLDVLFSWRGPTALFVTSEPDGATVRVDGVALPDPAPCKTSVRRDRFDHILEVTHPGYRPAREIVRYDRSVVLSFVVRLQQEAAPPPPAPAGGATPPSGGTQAVPPGGERNGRR